MTKAEGRCRGVTELPPAALGPGLAFRSAGDFLAAIDRGGVGAMEIVSMEMKARGMFVSRCLAFTGAEFELKEVPIPPEYTAVYDGACALWAELFRLLQSQGFSGSDRRQFWGAHQRCFRYLCIGAKVGTPTTWTVLQ